MQTPFDFSQPPRAQADTILSVAQLNRRVGSVLQGSFSSVWVRGEVSNFTQAASGHWYFTLKDEQAAVRAVMFRGRAQAVGFVPRAGEQLELRAGVTLYEARGEYQLQVEVMRRAGRGDLHAAFLALRDRLAAEGLFDPARKRQPAAVPGAVGVVTSLAAAALRDVLSVLARRAPHVRVVIYPAPVQGADAAGRLRQALAEAIQRNEVETLLLVRGGGSLEDLWSFNDEDLARAIAASPIPVISGVGHETDFTIADFVADVRAPTPTAAAELCCQPRQLCLERVQAAYAAMTRHQMRRLETSALRLDRAVARLVSPAQRLQRQRTDLYALCERLARAAHAAQRQRTGRLALLGTRLEHAQPDLAWRRQLLVSALRRLGMAGPRASVQAAANLGALRQRLESLHPGRTLARGYAIARDARGELVKNALDLEQGDRLSLEFGQGSALVQVLQRTKPGAR